MLFNALKRGWSAFDRATTRQSKIAVGVFFGIGALTVVSIVVSVASNTYTAYRADHAPPAEQLQMARSFCPPAPNNAFACGDSEMDIALHHLDMIPASAPEYSEASKLRSSIQAFRARVAAARQKAEEDHAAQLVKQNAEFDRLIHQSIDESRGQMMRNVSGQAHDKYSCSSSPDNSVIISYDQGHYWWSDDGRCAAELQKGRQLTEAKETAEQQRREQEQKARDADAEFSSYWPTTLRVDTDMDSFWLVNEERTCQTHPDEKGRVAVVSCNASGTHKDHNIPVKFWGGVDRNTVSDWRCRRESDDFVCRAIN